jgi:SAM-dependent methyltransferase
MARIHDQAQGFSLAAEEYEKSRPEYPAEAIDFLRSVLRIGPGSRVLEVGAGTGKFTRALTPIGADLIAMDPIAQMRSVLHRVLPDVPVLAGQAEGIPLREGSVQAIVVAQAFHWFRGAEALQEFARVLGPKGRVALVWNVRDERVAWVRRFTEIIDRFYEGGPYGEMPSAAPRHRSGEWRKAFSAGSPFPVLEHRQFAFRQPMTPEQVVLRAWSVSFIARRSPEERAQIADEIRSLLEADPATRGRSVVEYPYLTDVYWAERADRAA